MIPGKILIVDDSEKDVKELIEQFRDSGEHVLYSDTLVKEEYYANIRLLITDFWLHEDDEKHSLETIATIINEVFMRSKFFMVAIWSVKVTPENKEEYKQKVIEAVCQKLGSTQAPCIILDVLSKKDLDSSKLIEKISKEIKDYPTLNLLFEAEKILNKAKDDVANQIYDLGNWSTLLKNLKEEYDTKSIERQVLDIYMTFLKRRILPSKGFNDCLQILLKQEEDDFNLEDFGRFFSSQYYYKVEDIEQIANGDLLYNKEKNKYYVIITPECDIAQDKNTALKLIEAERVNHKDLNNSEYLSNFAKQYELKLDKDRFFTPKGVIKAIMFNSNMRNNFSSLLFFQDGTTKDFYHLIFDFHRVKSVEKTKNISDLKDYERLGRLDSPMITEFIRRYVSQCLRFGVMSLPKDQIRTELYDLLDKFEEEKKKLQD